MTRHPEHAMGTTTISVEITLEIDLVADTLHDVQQRFLETLEADGLHHAEITSGCVDQDDVPI